MKRYNSETPPRYDSRYGKINIPVHFVAGGMDKLVPEKDVYFHFTLLKKARPELASYSFFKNAGHLEFTIGLDSEVNNHILRHVRGRRGGKLSPTTTIPSDIKGTSRSEEGGDLGEATQRIGFSKVDHELKPYV